jgi:hypothetical protein
MHEHGAMQSSASSATIEMNHNRCLRHTASLTCPLPRSTISLMLLPKVLRHSSQDTSATPPATSFYWSESSPRAMRLRPQTTIRGRSHPMQGSSSHPRLSTQSTHRLRNDALHSSQITLCRKLLVITARSVRWTLKSLLVSSRSHDVVKEHPIAYSSSVQGRMHDILARLSGHRFHTSPTSQHPALTRND